MACQNGTGLEAGLRSASNKLIALIEAEGDVKDSSAVDVARSEFTRAVDFLMHHRSECSECSTRSIAELCLRRPTLSETGTA